MIKIKSYNTKIIDFGNGKKQVITYKYPVTISDDYEKEMKNIYQSSSTDNNTICDLSQNEIEKKAFHSFTTSANRSKNELYKLARANSWDWFITFTFDKNIVDDRTNYDLLVKIVGKLFNNWKSRKCPGFKYLFVPEQHKRIEDNGLRAWHFHGLISNADGLTFIKLTDEEKRYYDIHTDRDVYRIKEYKLGFCTATKIENTDKASNYITKYMTKQICSVLKNKRRYINSRNCNKPKEYTYMCMTHNDSMYDLLDENVYLSDIVDLSKVVYRSQKSVCSERFDNEYTYYELEGDYTPIIRKNDIIKEK